MGKTIRPDGSLDPAADFEDDGASFRVRRETSLRKQDQRRDRWSWRYLISEPTTPREASEQAMKIWLRGMGYLFLGFIGFVAVIMLLAWANIIH